MKFIFSPYSTEEETGTKSEEQEKKSHRRMVGLWYLASQRPLGDPKGLQWSLLHQAAHPELSEAWNFPLQRWTFPESLNAQFLGVDCQVQAHCHISS